MFKYVTLFLCMVTSANADQMTYTFKNPQFSGDGFSSHVLTIENQEFTRKKQIEAEWTFDTCICLNVSCLYKQGIFNPDKPAPVKAEV